ncbi:MAG: hypothetical protein KAU31_04395, partial [Spirochaetaceae bacterium]|nr:hypothetical protein [Spirochaetaceae bacterium]
MRKVSSIPVSAALIALVGLSLGSCNIAPTALTLQAADQWLATGVEARPGDVLLISATGLISYNSDLFPDAVTGPNGELSLPTPAENEPATADTYPLPTARYGALVGKIGSDGDVFFIGAE